MDEILVSEQPVSGEIQLAISPLVKDLKTKIRYKHIKPKR